MNWGTFFETLGIFGGTIVFTVAMLGLLALTTLWTGSIHVGALITVAFFVVGIAIVFGVMDR